MSLVRVSKAKLETGLGLKKHWEKAGGHFAGGEECIQPRTAQTGHVGLAPEGQGSPGLPWFLTGTVWPVPVWPSWFFV